MKVNNIHVDRERNDLVGKSFTGIRMSRNTPETTTYTTPDVSCMLARDLSWIITRGLTGYTVSDFSQDVTVVELPEGQQCTYIDTRAFRQYPIPQQIIPG